MEPQVCQSRCWIVKARTESLSKSLLLSFQVLLELVAFQKSDECVSFERTTSGLLKNGRDIRIDGSRQVRYSFRNSLFAPVLSRSSAAQVIPCLQKRSMSKVEQ